MHAHAKENLDDYIPIQPMVYFFFVDFVPRGIFQ